jgi:hypothetical protein
MWKPKAIRSKTIEKTLKRSELLNPIVSASSERMRDALKCLVFKFLYANNLLTSLEDSRLSFYTFHLHRLCKRCRVQNLRHILELETALCSPAFPLPKPSLTRHAALSNNVDELQHCLLGLLSPPPHPHLWCRTVPV